MVKSASAQEDVKKRVGLEGAALVQDGMVVGLGTGSTAAFAIEEIGRRVREEELHVLGVATSFSATLLARQNGIEVRALADVQDIDLALDGADEVDDQRNLIKGGGAAHTMEKVIDGAAEKFVVLVDDSKMVRRLGDTFPVPVEVLPFAADRVSRQLEGLGCKAELRFGSGKDGPVVTDLGNLVVDLQFDGINDVAGLSTRIHDIPGVVEHGLFVGLADLVLIGRRDSGEIDRLE